MRRIGRAVAVLLTVALAASGCAFGPPPPQPVPQPTHRSPAPPAPLPPVPDGYDAARDAGADVHAALAASSVDGKPVLLDFGADWCPACRSLQRAFQDPRAQALLRERFHTVAVDVGHFERNLAVWIPYVDVRRHGIPAVVIACSDGTMRTLAANKDLSNAANDIDPDKVVAFLTRWSTNPTA